MAEVRNVPSSILASDGKELRTGILSLLRKKKSFMKQLQEHELCPLYWRLLDYAGNLYMLGYKKQQPGSKVYQKLIIKGCSTELKPSERVTVSYHSNETFLCIQHPEGITFLKAESKRHRDKWTETIRQAISEPIYFPSSLSSVSTASGNSFTDFDARIQERAVRSFHATTDTAPVNINNWRRINTAPTGQFQSLSHQASVDSVPERAGDLARLQQLIDREEHNKRKVPVEQRCPGSSCASTLSRPQSLHNIYAENAQYGGLGHYDAQVNAQSLISSDDFPGQYMLDGRPRTLSSGNISRVCDDGPKAMFQQPIAGPFYVKPNSNYQPLTWYKKPTLPFDGIHANQQAQTPEYDDTVTSTKTTPAVPTPPPRDYVTFRTGEKKYSKKGPAPQPPNLRAQSQKIANKTHQRTIDDVLSSQPEVLDSIAREKTVTAGEPNLETKRCAIEATDPSVPEPTEEYVKKFRTEQFESSGILIEIHKSKLTRATIKLVCIGDIICVAGISEPTLTSKLHVGDVIVKINAQILPSINFCYDLFSTTDEDKVQLQVSRVPHGVMAHVILPANGRIETLGLKFDNSGHGNEVTSIASQGLVAKSGNPSRPKTTAVSGKGMLVNWALVEINEQPVSLDCTPEDVRRQLTQAGIELTLIFLPIDMVHILRGEDCCHDIGGDEDNDIYADIIEVT